MKKLLALLAICHLAFAIFAQSTSTIYFDHWNGGSTSSILCNNTTANAWTATSGIGDGTAVISYSTVSNCWVVSSLTSGGEWTQTAPQYPANGATAQLYNPSGPITGGSFSAYYLHFNGFIAPTPAVTNWTQTTTNFWTEPGDSVQFSGSGYDLSSGINSNQLVIAVDGNQIFTSPWTSGARTVWTLSGQVVWDGSNFISTGVFSCGDTNNPTGGIGGYFSNVVVGTNHWTWSVLGDTNGLTFTSANIVPSRVPTNDLPQYFLGYNSLVTVSNNLNTASNLTSAVAANLNVVSNNFVTVSNKFLFNGIPVDANSNGHWGTNGLNLVYAPSLYYGIGNNGIDDGTYPNIGFNGFILENSTASLCDFAWAALDDDGGSFYTSLRLETRSGFVLTGGAKELQFGLSASYVGGFGYVPNLLLGDNYATSTLGFSIGEGNAPTTPPVNGLHVVGNVQFDSIFSSDAGTFTSDGSGNVTAQTFTPVSDRALKENIQPIQPGKSLDMVLSLTNYQWNFKPRTNLFLSISRQTNSAVTNAQSKAGLILTTNLTQRVFPASGRQFGPMAQDWHAVTGLDDGHHISTTAMQGLLLGAIQDTAGRLPTMGTITSSTDAAPGPGLIRWDANYLYLSVNTNQWRRVALNVW